MPAPCSICSHPQRAEIDEALRAGASLAAVAAQFGLPSRTSLHRHRTGHLGRAVTFNLPATTAAPLGAAPGGTEPIDTSAELERLFARAAGSSRSLQDYARLLCDGLAHVYAAANASGDLSVAVRALREMRAMLAFHALVQPEKLGAHPGWRTEPKPVDPLSYLERWLTAPMAADPDLAASEALEGLAASNPAMADGLRAFH